MFSCAPSVMQALHSGGWQRVPPRPQRRVASSLEVFDRASYATTLPSAAGCPLSAATTCFRSVRACCWLTRIRRLHIVTSWWLAAGRPMSPGHAGIPSLREAFDRASTANLSPYNTPAASRRQSLAYRRCRRESTLTCDSRRLVSRALGFRRHG